MSSATSLFYQQRVGFDAFAWRPDVHHIDAAVHSLRDLNAAYQYSTDSQFTWRRLTHPNPA